MHYSIAMIRRGEIMLNCSLTVLLSPNSPSLWQVSLLGKKISFRILTELQCSAEGLELAELFQWIRWWDVHIQKSTSQINLQPVVSQSFQQLLNIAQKLLKNLCLKMKYLEMKLYGGRKEQIGPEGTPKVTEFSLWYCRQPHQGCPSKGIHKS